MPLSLQNRLLRVIEEKRVRRIGGTKFIPVDVRIITATNKDLWKMVEEGKITAEEAMNLMEAMGEKREIETKGKFLKILVMEGGDKKVYITLPLKLFNLIKKFIPESKMQAKVGDREINIAEILDSLGEELKGEIINIEDEESGDKVKIWVE